MLKVFNRILRPQKVLISGKPKNTLDVLGKDDFTLVINPILPLNYSTFIQENKLTREYPNPAKQALIISYREKLNFNNKFNNNKFSEMTKIINNINNRYNKYNKIPIPEYVRDISIGVCIGAIAGSIISVILFF